MLYTIQMSRQRCITGFKDGVYLMNFFKDLIRYLSGFYSHYRRQREAHLSYQLPHLES
jgi:hypothetical protein